MAQLAATFAPKRESAKQKTFASLSRFYPAHVCQCPKVFWFFFSKKTMLPYAITGCFAAAASRSAPAQMLVHSAISGVTASPASVMLNRSM